jgi:hypothetical protein
MYPPLIKANVQSLCSSAENMNQRIPLYKFHKLSWNQFGFKVIDGCIAFFEHEEGRNKEPNPKKLLCITYNYCCCHTYNT